MVRILKKLFIENWYKKIFSVIVAMVLWVFLNHSITSTKVFPKVAVRVVNLPPETTVRGLLPNGILERRITITLTGEKSLIDKLDSSDIEVVIDAQGKGSEWAASVGKKNLVSLNPDIDLIHNISSIKHSQFIIRLSKQVTDRIPVYFSAPRGESPPGYQFLDITPARVTHTLTGPLEDIEKLKRDGLVLTFDLNAVSKEDLDALRSTDGESQDEVSFNVPESWKQVSIPFLGNLKQDINGTDAKNLRIDFLRKELLLVGRSLPIRVFYPVETSATINPENCPLSTNAWIVNQNGIFTIKKSLYASGVSRHFLDIVRDQIEVVVIGSEKDPLRWDVDFVDRKELENSYVEKLLVPEGTSYQAHKSYLQEREHLLRRRFRGYVEKFQLMNRDSTIFELVAKKKHSSIVVEE